MISSEADHTGGLLLSHTLLHNIVLCADVLIVAVDIIAIMIIFAGCG